MLKLGVIPAEDMIPEVAFVKLSWVLGQTRDMSEVRRLMLTPVAGELNPRSDVGTYILVLNCPVDDPVMSISADDWRLK